MHAKSTRKKIKKRQNNNSLNPISFFEFDSREGSEKFKALKSHF